jgi:hypothetical protein
MMEEEKIRRAKMKAIIALEEMKKKEDEAARYNAFADMPNADFHYKTAEQVKAKIDLFIRALKNEESTEGRVMDTIVRTIVKAAIE